MASFERRERRTGTPAGSGGADRAIPDELEVASGLMLGRQPGAQALDPREDHSASVVEAISAVARRALQHPPTFVSFSGGRDSSAVLAIALRVARAEGHQEPIPITMDFPDPHAQEEQWQRVVLDSLGIDGKSERVAVGPDLDLLGQSAYDCFTKIGLVFPANTYLHTPVFRIAKGGSLLTGIGGDELLGSGTSGIIRIVADRRRPHRADLKHIVADAFPRLTLGTRFNPGDTAGRSWLTDDALARVRSMERRELLPRRWHALLRQYVTTRYYAAVSQALTSLGAAHSVRVLNPFYDRAVVAACAAHFGWQGYADRTEAMRQLFGEILPPATIARSSKASFDRSVWGELTREFTQTWTGQSQFERLLRPDALREQWAKPAPHFGVALLTQALAFGVKPLRAGQ